MGSGGSGAVPEGIYPPNAGWLCPLKFGGRSRPAPIFISRVSTICFLSSLSWCHARRPDPPRPQGHRSPRPTGARGPQRSQQVAGVGRWAAELAPVGDRSSRPARGRRALAGSLATCGRRSSRPAHGRSSRRADWRRAGEKSSWLAGSRGVGMRLKMKACMTCGIHETLNPMTRGTH
jgi:hypothetical protein